MVPRMLRQSPHLQEGTPVPTPSHCHWDLASEPLSEFSSVEGDPLNQDRLRTVLLPFTHMVVVVVHCPSLTMMMTLSQFSSMPMHMTLKYKT